METVSVERRWSKATVALVTGANQGIGLQIVREFAKRGLTSILTSRNEARGTEAIALLKEEGLEVVYHQLDITSADSVHRLVNWLSETYGAIDTLVSNFRTSQNKMLVLSMQVNNAGISPLTGLTLEGAKMVIATNYYGSKRMVEAIVPLMKPGARIVNVSSKASDLTYLKNEWRAKLEDIPNLTTEAIDEFLEQFTAAVGKGEIESKGWPCVRLATRPPDYLADYSASKMALNAYTRHVAEELKAKQVFVNCLCPGATSTSMTRNFGHSVEMGADTAVWLALLSTPQIPAGRFFMDRKDVGFSEMPVFFHGKFIMDEGYNERIREFVAAIAAVSVS